MLTSMTQASAAKKLVSAAALGSGGLSVVGATLYGLLRAEAKIARWRIGNAKDHTTPDPSGVYGANFAGPECRMILLGDSSAAGYGVPGPIDTPGHTLANRLAGDLRRPVDLQVFAKVGAQTTHLMGQIEQGLDHNPDLAVIFIGANDVTHRVVPATSVRALSEAVERLQSRDIAVVIGTCPDLGTIRPIAPPLRQVARVWSRRLADAQALVAEEAGALFVALGEVLGPDFDAEPEVYFGADRFHPSVTGYRALADVVVPVLVRALGR
jgi:lysophospholipase L1-like esterase